MNGCLLQFRDCQLLEESSKESVALLLLVLRFTDMKSVIVGISVF
ncbi:hypothetical protein [Neobacillus drentensis]